MRSGNGQHEAVGIVYRQRMATTRIEQARRFRELHHTGRILVLPNAWDAASARVFEQAGFPAIGTTSAGVAWSLGHPDGQRVARQDALAAIRRIVRSVGVPVTADVERGLGTTPAELTETARELIDAGAVGVNLEDGRDGGRLTPADVHVERIRAFRGVADEAGVPLFINARTDVYFLPSDDPRAQVAEVLRRAALFVAAGADGLFVPGITEPEHMAEIARAVSVPVNVYAFAGVPSARELEALGVARVSVGCGPMQATLGLTRRIAEELRDHGTWVDMSAGALPAREVNELMGR
jgi:2-methylisocitrate lyase-like PEP mutase family enzyme